MTGIRRDFFKKDNAMEDWEYSINQIGNRPIGGQISLKTGHLATS